MQQAIIRPAMIEQLTEQATIKLTTIRLLIEQSARIIQARAQQETAPAMINPVMIKQVITNPAMEQQETAPIKIAPAIEQQTTINPAIKQQEVKQQAINPIIINPAIEHPVKINPAIAIKQQMIRYRTIRLQINPIISPATEQEINPIEQQDAIEQQEMVRQLMIRQTNMHKRTNKDKQPSGIHISELTTRQQTRQQHRGIQIGDKTRQRQQVRHKRVISIGTKNKKMKITKKTASIIPIIKAATARTVAA